MNNRIKISIIITFMLIVTISILSPTDSTDKSRWNRSGMSLYIDNGTGCHYLTLSSGFLGKATLIPRMNSYGNHVCKELR